MTFPSYTINQIRKQFKHVKPQKNGMREILHISFLADQPRIFGEPNSDYIKREIAWYDSMSLNINDMEGPIPSRWKTVADKHGNVNSNYGWCIYSKENGEQFKNCLYRLEQDLNTRCAVMIYTPPSMPTEAINDFMCMNCVQFICRHKELYCFVQMRLSDAILGYPNDLAWHHTVQRRLVDALNRRRNTDVKPGPIYWYAGSLRVYPQHAHFLTLFSA